MRDDLVSIFFTGMTTTKHFTLQTPQGEVTVPAGTNVNHPADVRPAEMLRLNLAEPVPARRRGQPLLARAELQARPAGWRRLRLPQWPPPAGRRHRDRTAGRGRRSLPVLTDEEFDFNPDLIGVLNDGVDANDSEFGASFPYLAQPHRGLDFRSNGDWGAGE